MQNKKGLDLEFIKIPEGNFFMGSDGMDDEADGDERPQRRVWLTEYQIQKTPVTVGQWKVFLEETNYKWPIEEWEKKIVTRKILGKRKNKYPITYVSWFDSYAFTKWLSAQEGKNYNLPTEAQWEKACRGIDKRRYPCDYEYDILDWKMTAYPVGSNLLNASFYGCLDMNTNVYEWCWDWYDIDYYEHMPLLNPKGVQKGKYKSVRSNVIWGDTRCCKRNSEIPESRSLYRGFRMVRNFELQL